MESRQREAGRYQEIKKRDRGGGDGEQTEREQVDIKKSKRETEGGRWRADRERDR